MVEKISTNTITGVSPTLKDQGTKEQIKVKPEEKQKETKKTEKAKSGTKQSANTQVSAAATTSSVNVTQENSVQAPATNPEANLAPSGGAGENTATVVISEDVKKENAIYRLLIKWVGNNQEKEVELRKDLEDGKLSWDEAQKLGMTKQAFNLLSVGGAVNKVKKNGTVKGAGYITAEDAEKFQKGTIEDIAKGTNQEGAVIGAYLTANKFAVVNKGEAVRRFNGSSLKGAGAKTLLDSITDLNIKAAATSILKNLGKEATDDTALNDKELGAFLITLSFLGQLKDDERARIMLEAKSLGKPSSASTEDYLVWVFPGAKDWESADKDVEKSSESTGKIEIPGQKEFIGKIYNSDGTLKAGVTPLDFKDVLDKYTDALGKRYEELKGKVVSKSISNEEKTELQLLANELISKEGIRQNRQKIEDIATFAINNEEALSYDGVRNIVSSCITALIDFSTKNTPAVVEKIMKAFEVKQNNREAVKVKDSDVTSKNVKDLFYQFQEEYAEVDSVCKRISNILSNIHTSPSVPEKVIYAAVAIYLVEQNKNVKEFTSKLAEMASKDLLDKPWKNSKTAIADFITWISDYTKV